VRDNVLAVIQADGCVCMRALAHTTRIRHYCGSFMHALPAMHALPGKHTPRGVCLPRAYSAIWGPGHTRGRG